MKGRAMLAMVLSSTTMSWATQMSTSAQRRFFWVVEVPGEPSTAAVVSVMSSSLGSSSSTCGCSVGAGLLVASLYAARRVLHGGEDHVVDDALDGRVVRWDAEDEGPVHEDPGEGGADQLDVEVVADLAASLGALVDALGDGDLRRDELLPELGCELGVRGERGDDRAHRSGRGAVHALVPAEGAEQVRAQ